MIPAVVSHLIQHQHIVDAASTFVLFTGSSAGAEALLPNIDLLAFKLLPKVSVCHKLMCDTRNVCTAPIFVNPFAISLSS